MRVEPAQRSRAAARPAQASTMDVVLISGRDRIAKKAEKLLGSSGALCVFCLCRAANSREHVVAQTLGGRFWLPISCETCNNEIGSALESQLLECRVVQQALLALAEPKLADLVTKVRRHLQYEGHTRDGERVELVHRRGKAVVPRRETPQGAVHASPEDAAKEIETRARRKGIELSEVAQSMLNNFNGLAEGVWFTLPGTEYLVRKDELRVRAKVSDVPVPRGVLAKLVLGIFPLRFGRGAYHPSLDRLREAVRDGQERPGLHFGYLGDAMDRNEVGAEHVARVELRGSLLIADVLFFRKHRFTVTLEGVPHARDGAGIVFIEDVAGGRTAATMDLEDFARTKRARFIRPL